MALAMCSPTTTSSAPENERTGLFSLLGGPPFNYLYLPPPARNHDLGMSALVVGMRFCRRQHAMLLVDPPHRWKTVRQAARPVA